MAWHSFESFQVVIMYQLLVICVLINFVVANEQSIIKYGEETNSPNAVENKNNLGFPKWRQHFWKPPKKVHRNASYFDRAENMIRLPIMSKFTDKKDKKKLLKKSPKRTVQKIIKKNRQKTKKIYVVKMTSPPVPQDDFDREQDDMAQWKDDSTTAPSNQKKKPRKYNYSKIARYPMPFQRMQKMRSHRRDKRSNLNREDFFILKDFNEIKLVRGGDNDFDFKNVHIRKDW